MSNVLSSCIRTGTALVLVGLLGAAGPAIAASGGPAFESSRDSLTAAAVAFHLRYGPATDSVAARRDRWVARDKARHVVFSGLWTLSTQYVLVNKAGWSEGNALPASIASAAVVGVAKEAYDASCPAGTVSGKDLVADAVGIGLAAGLIAL